MTKIKKADSYAFGALSFSIAAMSLKKGEEAIIHSFQNKVLRHVTRTPPVWVATKQNEIRTRHLKENIKFSIGKIVFED